MRFPIWNTRTTAIGISLTVLTGCTAPVYVGWSVDAAQTRYSAAEAVCTRDATNGIFKRAGEWSGCLIAANQQFAADISLTRPELLASYSTRVQALAVELDARHISGRQFQDASQVAREGFRLSIKSAEFARQQEGNDAFATIAAPMLVGAAIGASSQPRAAVNPSLMSPVRDVGGQPAAAPALIPVAPVPMSPLAQEPRTANCNGLAVSQVVTVTCRAQ